MNFGQEVKDFLNAYSAGQKINASKTDEEYKRTLMDATSKKTARDNDPDNLELQTQTQRAQLDNLRSQISSRNTLTGARAAALRAAANPTGMPGVAPDDANVGGAVAATAHPFVPAYATGGMVQDGEGTAPTPDVDTEAGLDENDVADDTLSGNEPTPAVTDISARARSPQQQGGSLQGISPAVVHDATKDGLIYGVNSMGIGSRGGVMTRAQQQKALAYARGFGALPPAELDKVKKAVDPDGKLSEAQRNMAALGAVFQYQMNKGNPEGAQRAAFQVLQAYRLDSMRYAAIAAHAAENGNLDLAAQAAIKAYANVPDGNDIHLQKADDGRLMFSYTDGATGKVIQKGLITPQELAAQATGLAKNGFDKAILSAAGQREEETKNKSGGALKVNDVDKLATAAQGAVYEMLPKIEKDIGAPLSDSSKRILGGTTMRILKNNLGGLTANEAVVAAHDILGNTNADAFKVKKGDDGVNTIVFGPKSALGAGYSIKLDDSALEPVIAQRAAMMAAQKKKSEEADATGKRRAAIASRIGKAAGDVAGDVVGVLSVGGDAPALRDDAPLAKVGRFVKESVLSLRDHARNAGAVDTAPLDYQGEQTP